MGLSKFDEQMRKQGWEEKRPFLVYLRDDGTNSFVAFPGKRCLEYRDIYDENDLDERIDVEKMFTIKAVEGENWVIDLLLELMKHARYHGNEKQFNFFKDTAESLGFDTNL